MIKSLYIGGILFFGHINVLVKNMMIYDTTQLLWVQQRLPGQVTHGRNGRDHQDSTAHPLRHSSPCFPTPPTINCWHFPASLLPCFLMPHLYTLILTDTRLFLGLNFACLMQNLTEKHPSSDTSSCLASPAGSLLLKQVCWLILSSFGFIGLSCSTYLASQFEFYHAYDLLLALYTSHMHPRYTVIHSHPWQFTSL